MPALITREPALFGGFVTALVALVATFGFHLDNPQSVALQGAIAAVTAILVAIGVRSQVTPVAFLTPPPPPPPSTAS